MREELLMKETWENTLNLMKLNVKLLSIDSDSDRLAIIEKYMYY